MSTVRQSEASSEIGTEREARGKMMKISVEVRSGAARFRVGVQAKGIREALALVGSSCPRGEVGSVFPIEPEGFFLREPAALAGTVATEQTHREAARRFRRKEVSRWGRRANAKIRKRFLLRARERPNRKGANRK